MLTASRIGTPAATSVPSVRVKRATDDLPAICPTTGIFSVTESRICRPIFDFRITLYIATNRMGDSKMYTHPGGVPLANQLEMLISATVSPGSCASKSLKIVWNFGTTFTMMKVTMPPAIEMTTAG